MTPPVTLRTSVLLRAVLILAFAISIGFAISIFFSAHQIGDLPQALGYYATATGIVLIAALVGKRSFELCSVTLTELGVEQWCVFCNGKILSKKQLRWQEITDVSAKPGAFLLAGSVGKIEVNTMVFNEANVVIEFVRKMCPNQAGV